MRDCWEFFNEIALQKKKSSQAGNAAANPKIVLGKVIAQGIGEWDAFYKLPPVNILNWTFAHVGWNLNHLNLLEQFYY